jgi:hypothetical protein
MSRGEKLKALRRRASFLQKRIESSKEKRLTFDMVEFQALTWAINTLSVAAS